MFEANRWKSQPAAATGSAALVLALALAALPASAGAQVAPGPEYEAGSLARLAWGDNWRELWTTPTDAPVFDLDRVAGGLEWVQRGGGYQSITLHLVERDGWREYRFRSVNKYPVIQAMPPAIQGTTAGRIIQDQVSTLFPAAPLLVPPLLEAIGVLHVRPTLYVMPDDPRLGVYQDTFAGMVGTFELKPDEAPGDEPGFAGSRKIKSTANFFDDLRNSRDHRLDERELLAARLVDFMIGDTDRTPDNFRWARFGDEAPYTWRPIPNDRDRAFMHAGGLVNSLLVRRVYPKLVTFERGFSLSGLTHTSHPIDRRLLQRLDRHDFEETALHVQRAIDADVIEEVVASLPPSWRGTGASARLRDVLTARHAGLPGIARAFYDDLAGEVDIHGTEEDELASIHRHTDGRVTVTLTGREDPETVEVVRHDDGGVTLSVMGTVVADAGPAAPFYERTFLPGETNEVRVYLGGGDDLAIVRGAPTTGLAVRVIGGPGDDVLVDSAGGGATYFYDSEGDDRFVTARGTSVDMRTWEEPEQVGGLRVAQAWSPDWGGTRGWSVDADYVEGSGIVLGAGPSGRSYGFRRLPHHWRADAKLHVGLGSGRLGVTADADYRAENSPLAWRLAAAATQLEAFRFYGFGNDTERVTAHRSLVWQDRVSAEPALVWHLGWRAREGLSDPLRGEGSAVGSLRPVVGELAVGPVVYWSHVRPVEGSPAATVEDGFMAGGRAGIRLDVTLDRTDRDPVPTLGWTLTTRLDGYPPLWELAESFGTASATGSAYLPLPVGGTHLAVRAGGALAAGPAPVQHSPAIGGRTTLRGYRWQRFTGDTSAFGSAELRVPVGTVPLFLKWDAGLLALADAGRVWFDGESPGGWHTAVGGGVWLAALGQSFSVTFAYGEESRLYFKQGLSF
ncbi:MAG TPA: BamA/TamA family outer membrane protein [Longimicrobiales bacterium]|nr:BamA/TamA family outer membrane protein [Longimicrobiales bacterium]